MGPPQVDGGIGPLGLVSIWAGYRIFKKNNYNMIVPFFYMLRLNKFRVTIW
jgi:hypothetical protein